MYTQVDPSSIVFDFAYKKIKVNNPAESEWVQKAMFANGYSWMVGGTQIRHTENYFLVGEDRNLFYSSSDPANMAISIQEILDAQQPVFEVGDVVQNKYANKPGQYVYTIKSIKDGMVCYDDEGTDQLSLMAKSYNIIRKAKQQEIIGYELLKDLPGIPAGSKSTQYERNNHGERVVFGLRDAGMAYYAPELQDTTWFRPIYKPTATVVEISGGRKVTIEGDKASLGDGVEFMNKRQVIALLVLIGAVSPLQANTGRRPYELEVLAFKLGCQEFTKEDLVKVRNAFTK